MVLTSSFPGARSEYFNLKKLVNLHKVNSIVFVNFQDSKAKKVEVFGIVIAHPYFIHFSQSIKKP